MKFLRFNRNLVPAFLAASLAGLSAAAMYGQVQTETTTTAGQSTHEVKVERGEVAYVSGNRIVVKMEDGTLRDFPNLPESDRITVDGQQLSVRDLKPGMKLEHTITTTTTPRVITTTQTVTGKVWHVTPPKSVIVTLEDGTNQQFTIPDGQKFNVNGQMLDAFALRKGMRISATKVVEVPETLIAHERSTTGTMPPPPPPPAADMPILVVFVHHMPAAPVETASAEPAPTRLPKTASLTPLLGLLGLASLLVGFGIRLYRRPLLFTRM